MYDKTGQIIQKQIYVRFYGRKIDFSDIPVSIVDFHKSHGDFSAKTTPATASRIQPQPSIDHFFQNNDDCVRK